MRRTSAVGMSSERERPMGLVLVRGSSDDRSPDSVFADIDYYDHSARRNGIGWTSDTFQQHRGCSPVSEACRRCWAAECGASQIRQCAGRGISSPYEHLVVINNGRSHWTGVVERTGLEDWLFPVTTKTHRLLFPDSMSDFFHENLTDIEVLDALQVLFLSRWNTFQVLTKRHERMADFMSRLSSRDGLLHLSSRSVPAKNRCVLPNVWFGVTVENDRRAQERIPALLSVQATVRWLSMEPLLSPVDLTPWVADLHWVIVGGESATDFREMPLQWARDIRDQCAAAGVAYWFKQRAGKRPHALPKDLDGVVYHQFPRRELGSFPSAPERRSIIRLARTIYAAGSDSRDGRGRA